MCTKTHAHTRAHSSSCTGQERGQLTGGRCEAERFPQLYRSSDEGYVLYRVGLSWTNFHSGISGCCLLWSMIVHVYAHKLCALQPDAANNAAMNPTSVMMAQSRRPSLEFGFSSHIRKRGKKKKKKNVKIPMLFPHYEYSCLTKLTQQVLVITRSITQHQTPLESNLDSRDTTTVRYCRKTAVGTKCIFSFITLE